MADRALIAKYVYNSNRLDGVHIPFETTLELTEEPPAEGDSVEVPSLESGKTYFHHHVTSHVKALESLPALAKEAAYTVEHLRSLHERLMEGVILSNGEFRECTLKSKGIAPLPPAEIPARLNRLLSIMNLGFERARDKAIFAWQVHHEMIHVHPFIEGNGRMARLLLNLMRYRAGLELEVVHFAQHDAYMKSILAYGQKLTGGAAK